MRTRSTFLLLLLSVTLSLPVAGGDLPADLSRLLIKNGIPQDGVSLEVRKIGQPEPVVSLNAGRPRNPASVIKLVTTLAALELLGPAYTWQTEYHLDGAFRDGRLDGNLVLRGGGDPYLVTEQFWRQLHALRDRGLREITGDLVLDDSALTTRGGDRGRFDGQAERVYNVIPSASMVNYSATRFVFTPRRGKLTIFADPPGDNLRVENHIALTSGKCIGYRKGWSYKTRRSKNETVVEFTGRYPAACGEYSLTRAVLPNADYTYGVFRTMWRELGGALDGGFRHGNAPGGKPYLSSSSKPLSEVIAGVNKFSNNIMARQLLLTIGRELYGEPGSAESGIRGVRQWLESKQVAMPELVLENGSGLSRNSRVSARGFANLLQAGWSSTYRPEYLASFSLAATDGTMRKRLRGRDLEGRIRIKTGLLKNTRSMAGYVKSRGDDDYTVVMLLNGAKVNFTSGNQVQDALLRWVLER